MKTKSQQIQEHINLRYYLYRRLNARWEELVLELKLLYKQAKKDSGYPISGSTYKERYASQLEQLNSLHQDILKKYEQIKKCQQSIEKILDTVYTKKED